MDKKVLFGKEARNAILQGVKKITDAVRVTMGASGKCVLIGESVYQDGFIKQLPTIISKDGFTVTKHFSLADPIENRGALLIKEAAFRTVEAAGDATTCTCVLAEAIISGGMELVNQGANSQEVKKGIDKAVERAVAELKEISILIGDDNDKIFQVASVSANNDPAIGRLIADAFKKIGPEGMIDIEAGKGVKTEIKIADGYKWQYDNWISPFFVNKPDKQVCEFEDPLILLYQSRITHHTQVKRAVELANSQSRPLLIVCEDAEGEGLAFLAINNHNKAIRVCVTKSPGFREERRIEMEDIALLTGGTYISDIRGVDIKEIELENLGQARKCIVSKEETIIIGGVHDGEGLENLLNELRMNLAQAKNEEERFPIEKRIAKLTGGVAVIQVGAATETEMKEKLDRFDDAVRSTKAAISEGFVAGGGTAFIRISQKLLKQKSIIDDDRDKGEYLIQRILTTPLRQMAHNSGVDDNAIFNKVAAASGNMGYNTLSGQIEDLVQCGIIDSTKALRCALINAASIAGMLIISECLIEAVA